jgi:glucose/arabinose dehydrogenase
MRSIFRGLMFMLALVPLPAIAQTLNDPSLVVETVVSGLSFPTTMAFIGNDDILALEQHTGRVRRVIAGVLQPGEVLDVPVGTSVDNGLLGIALDPDFVNNRRVFLYYTEALVDGGVPFANRVVRYTWDGVQLVDPRIVIDIPTPGTNEVGGIVSFGPDDKLYALVGAMERSGKLQNESAGPDPDDTGVVFRTNTDGSAPPDNPFFAATGTLAPMKRYFAYGIRNSFGHAFDPVTGALWDTENGPSRYDEINRVDAGFNSGWELLSGPDARSPQNESDLWFTAGAHYADPAFSWFIPVGVTSITFIQNAKLGCGRLHEILVGDSNCGAVRHFVPNASRNALAFTSPELQDLVADNPTTKCSQEQAELAFGSGFGVVSDFKTGPDGNLYVVDLIGGSIRRIKPALPAASDADADGVNDLCDCNAADAGSWSTTTEVPRVRVSGSGATTLGWDAQRAVVGPSVTYTVVSGSLAALRAGHSFASACTLDTGLTDPRRADSRPTPSSGDGYFYLVRASNGCGAGTFGDASPVPDPRDALDAKLPPACVGL